MGEPLPLFPLSTVLVPGQQLPLHVFEERYRQLVTELLELPEGAPRRFGVVAIRQGREAGQATVPELYDVGCTAELSEVRARADGRFDIVTTGGVRFRLLSVDTARPYLVGDIELVPEATGSGAAALAAAVRSAYDGYADAVEELGASVRPGRSLPSDPIALSYTVAATMLLDLGERQALLAAEDAARRLDAERRLLRREITLVRQLSALPAGAVVDLTAGSAS
jgi:Lon protease-like protein